MAQARIDLVLTIVGPDRPGLVELVSKTVTAHQGNWESSRMARMAGRFAGILQVSVPAEKADGLAAALAGLEGQGLRLVVDRAGQEAMAPSGGTHLLRVELVGNDRPGLIRDISSAMADRGINVEELTTECTAAPMAGGMLLRVTAQVRARREIEPESLRQALEARATDFMVDVARMGEPDGAS